MYADDHAIVGGPARLDGKPVMIIGQQKGRDTKERVRRNYGMPKPEGYRKALRLMRMAERFQMPLITFIDTSGAYPGVGAEERGQSEAIARNLFEMSTLRTPIVSVVIGEGGSGGALAIGVGDRLLMLQYSIYSVISPEGCAGILWRSADKKDLAAEAMGVSAERIAKLGVVDEVIKEPLGGAHRDPQVMADTVKDALLRAPRRAAGAAARAAHDEPASSGCAATASTARGERSDRDDVGDVIPLPSALTAAMLVFAASLRCAPRGQRRAALRRVQRRARLDRPAARVGSRHRRPCRLPRCAPCMSIISCIRTRRAGASSAAASAQSLRIELVAAWSSRRRRIPSEGLEAAAREPATPRCADPRSRTKSCSPPIMPTISWKRCCLR